jgi:hypothetical protein
MHCSSSMFNKSQCCQCDQDAIVKCTIEEIAWISRMISKNITFYYCNNHKEEYLAIYNTRKNIVSINVEEIK